MSVSGEEEFEAWKVEQDRRQKRLVLYLAARMMSSGND